MKKSHFGLVGVILSAISLFAAEPVVVGNARFTALTDRMIRMEYAPDGKFEDRASLVFVDRASTATDVRLLRRGKGCILETPALKLVYAGGEFCPATLSIELKGEQPPEVAKVWRFGDSDVRNLLGTTRTLDGVADFSELVRKMEPGLLSRGGWTVVDDTKSLLFEPVAGHWKKWVAPRPGTEGYRDLVFFGYGHDYQAALKDYTRVAGKIPLPPKWAFGYWTSRYWPYSDDEIDDIVAKNEDYGIPLDVFIIDMDWHETWGLGLGGGVDEFGQWNGWTGYTWKRNLFPDPEGLLKRLHDHNLKVALNLHPASGIQPMEECYDRFAAAYGWEGARDRKAIPYRLSERKWADTWYGQVLKPLERQGVDFWWLDWQQWLVSKYVPGLSNTFWLNHTIHRHESEKTDADGRALRPLIYHRWGGLGSHRYQMGFSGDTIIGWKMLAAIPYFTVTSGNVGYGYWGHDIGGHMFRDDAAIGKDPELFLRWLQGGVFTPLFKVHSTRNPQIERTLWNFPRHFDALREAVRLRYRLAPYIYTAAREAHDTGLSICRPLYWDESETEAAYSPFLSELKFGSEIVAVTVAESANPTTGVAMARFYLPAGGWYDAARGEVLEGSRFYCRGYTLEENPYFVKAGAILPLNPPSVRNLVSDRGEAIDLLVAPGAAEGAGELYEDDGVHADYETAFARTRFEMQSAGSRLVVKIGAREGAFAGMCTERVWRVVLPNRLAPERVTFNGKEIDWKYDGRLPGVVAAAPKGAAGAAAEFVFTFGREVAEGERMLAGFRGLANRARILSAEVKREVAGARNMAMAPDAWLDLSSLTSRLGAFPREAESTLEGMRDALAHFDERFVSTAEFLPAALVAKVKAMLFPDEADADRSASLNIGEVRIDRSSESDAKKLKPLFSWRTESLRAGAEQLGCRLRIFDGAGKLVWNSGECFFKDPFLRVGTSLERGSDYAYELRVVDAAGVWCEAAKGTFRTVFEEPVKAPVPTGNRGYDYIKSVWRNWRATGDKTLILEAWDDMTAAPVLKTEPDGFAETIGKIRAGWLMKEMHEAMPSLAPLNAYADIEAEARRVFAENYQTADGDLRNGVNGAAELLQALEARVFDAGGEQTPAKERAVKRLATLLRTEGMPPAEGRFEAEDSYQVIADDARLGTLAWDLLLKQKPESGLKEAAEQWTVHYGAGIREFWSTPGYSLFTLAPIFDARVNELACAYDSPFGKIESSWKFVGDGRFKWSYTIPAGTTAVVTLPDGTVFTRTAGAYVTVYPPEK